MADAAKEEFHPSFPNFKEVGSLDVDAGSIWIGDGCYVLKDKDEPRPKDLGDDWHDICERFCDRSGYDKYQEALRRWHEYGYRESWSESEEYKAINAERVPRPEGLDINASREQFLATDYGKWIERWVVTEQAFATEWRSNNPFKTDLVDTGCASFTHDGGHGGMGMMISTFYGDGSYPVYIEYGDNGRPRRVLIDFDPGADEQEEPDVMEVAE